MEHDVAEAKVEVEIEESNSEISVVQLMDIRTRLWELMSMIEKRVGLALSDYEFWLQDSKMLENHKTLVDQCIRGEGIVQVNVQIKPNLKRINIVDVLKPDEEFIDVDEIPTCCDDPLLDDDLAFDSLTPPTPPTPQTIMYGSPSSTMVKWAADNRFKAEQLRLNIPLDPRLWTVPHVRYWIQWAVRQFHLKGIKLSDWTFPGTHLVNLTVEEFKTKCPSDPMDLFWTHLEVLKSCKFIAIVQNEEEVNKLIEQSESAELSQSAMKKKSNKMSSTPVFVDASLRSGNNGQIQLWQFLLELLTSREHTDVIQWIGGKGEFKLQDPEMVAKLWGERKNKPMMNYEKLSRALRYYYDGDMIAKVHNKRFVYRFVCDLKQLIGYDASELARLVNAEPKKDPHHISLYC